MSKKSLEKQVWNRILVNQRLIMRALSMPCEEHQRRSLREAMYKTDEIAESISGENKMIERHKSGGKKPYKSKPGHKRPRKGK